MQATHTMPMKSYSVISFMVVLLHSVLSQPQGGRNVTVYGGMYQYVGIDLTHRTWVTFQVRTSRGAGVRLYQNHTIICQIVIGYNFNGYDSTCIWVYNISHVYVSCKHTPRVVSVDELRWFWISWQDDVFHFGSGYRPRLNIIHSLRYYENRVPPINIMAIASHYNNTQSFWSIPEVYYIPDYRLVYSSLPTEGRLQAKYVDHTNRWSWIPYAADNFDDHDAGVACLTLGFGRTGMAVRHHYRSQGFKIFVDCKGYESTLRECHQHIRDITTRDVFISCNNTVMQPAVAIQGWRLLVYPTGVNNTYGNNVTLRSASININYTYTSWISKISNLTAGIMKNFYLFIERRNIDPSLKRLQLWRPVSGSDYVLIWERLANVSGVRNHTLYKFDVSADNVKVSAGDCIGWLNEDNNTWISADHCSAHPCQCSASYDFGTTYDWPVVNLNSTFKCRPYSFSVAMEIEPFAVIAATTETEVTSHTPASNVQQFIITITIVVVCVVVLVVIIAAVLLLVILCYKRKRCCFAKSAPRPRASPTQNIYDLQPVADSSSTSSGQGTTDSPVSTTPSAAATDGRIYYDDSVAGSAGFAATTADCTTTR